jgi:hypothetical protein
VSVGNRIREGQQMGIRRQITAVAVVAAAALIGAGAPAHAASQDRTASLFWPRFASPLARAVPDGTLAGPGANVARALRRVGGASFRTVDVPGASGTLVDAVTDSGVAAGSYFTGSKGTKSHGFIEQGQQLIRVDYPGTSGVTALDGISDSGTAVGTFTDAAGTSHGWIRSAGGRFQELDDPLAGTGAGFGTFPEGINQYGVIVGFYVDNSNLAHGFVFVPGSGFTTLDVPVAGTASGQGTVAVSVNDFGVIAGTYIDSAGVYRGFVSWRGRFVEFAAPGAGTGTNQGTIPYGITRDGLISGWTLHGGNEISGWLLRNGHFTTLNDPLEATGPNLGSALYGINEQGTEAGGEYWDASGHFHGFVVRLPACARPATEPTAW